MIMTYSATDGLPRHTGRGGLWIHFLALDDDALDGLPCLTPGFMLGVGAACWGRGEGAHWPTPHPRIPTTTCSLIPQLLPSRSRQVLFPETQFSSIT